MSMSARMERRLTCPECGKLATNQGYWMVDQETGERLEQAIFVCRCPNGHEWRPDEQK